MSDSERPFKRQRISQACDYCRKRKSKCDGTQPVCSVCRLFDKPCTYGNAKKRGLQTGYVKGLESLLGLMIQDVPQSEVLVRSRLRNQYLNCSFTEGEFLEQTTDLWRRSDLAKDLDHLLHLQGTELEQGGQHPRDNLPPLPAFEEEQEPAIAQDTTIEPPALNEPVDEGNSVPQNQNAFLRFPDAVSYFVDVYFQNTQCWFPIIERRDILRILYQDNENDSAPPEDVSDEGHRLCIWAMIAFSSQRKPSQSLGSQCPTPWQIQSHLWSRLMSHRRSFDIGHIQTTLIMALCEVQRGAFEPAWILTAQAHRMHMAMDIPGSSMHERSQHVFQGCLYLDTVISALLEKVPFSSSAAYHCIPRLDENGLEEWEPWSPPVQDTRTDRHPMRVLSSFNMTRLLMEIMGEILGKPMDHQAIDHYVSDLQTWYSNMKKPHQLNDRSTPSILVLHLTWNFTVLTLFRRVQNFERQWIPLIQQAVRSISEISTRYLELTDTSSCNPLLLIFGLQAERSLDQIHRQTNQSDGSPDYLYLKKTLEILNSTFKNTTSVNTPKVQCDEPMAETITDLPPAQHRTDSKRHRGKPNEIAWQINEPDMLLSPMPTELLRQLSEARQSPRQNPPDLYQPVRNDSDQFDDIFDQMLSFIPSRRYDDDATTFAQNLGFLSNDIDLDLPTFHEQDKNVSQDPTL